MHGHGTAERPERLMKIKRLDIHGFKSFVDRTTITFPDPITAVVGPNGCGKSNIVDAIRWVMGEQSAKQLRGRAMEDVIFAGSESRGPAGFAEVSLTFDARSMPGSAAPSGVPWGAVGPEEVVVTRRLYRDGTSEYLLGGVPCRLRDIVDFFLGTGVGSKAYAIIEQGRIGFIVSSRPEDRRGLIDEAAGITKYKSKKKQAERRMESTRQHLLRVSDILGELDNRLRSLRIQAQKAERYKRYKAELRDLELWSASQRYLGLLAEEKSLKLDAAAVTDEHERLETTLRTEELAVEVERLALTEEMGELAAAKDELFALSNKADLGMQRAQHYDEESAALASRAAAAQDEGDDLARRSGESQNAIDALEGQIAGLEADAESRQGEYQAFEAAHDELRGRLMETRRRLDEATTASAGALARVARLESEIEAGAVRREDLGRRLASLVEEGGALIAQIEATEAEAARGQERLAVLAARREEVARRRDEANQRVADLRNEMSRGELEIDTLREESHRRRSRLQSLSEIQTRYESFQRGVRAIMKQYRAQAQETGESRPWSPEHAVRGLVADIVQPPPDLEAAVEAVLGERLGNIIVESHEVGVDAIEFLKERSEGRSSFIPLTLRAAPAEGQVIYDATGGALAAAPAGGAVSAVWPTGEGVRGPMLDLIGYDRSYHSVAAYLLGDVLVCEDLQKALSLWRETRTDKTIVTLDGEVIDPHGVVTGGSRESAVAGVLSQKREIRELQEVVARIEADLEAALGRQVSLKQSLSEAASLLEELTTATRQDELDLISEQKDLDRARREHGQLEARRKQVQTQDGDLRLGLENVERRLEQARATLEEERQAVAAAEALGQELRGQTVALTERLDGLIGELTAAKVAASQAADRRANARQNLDRLRRERDEQESRRARLQSSAAEELSRAEELRAEALRIREEASLFRAEAEERARAQAEREGAVNERNAALSRREAELRVLREQVARLAQDLASLQLRCQEASLRRTSLEEQVSDRYRDVRLPDVVYDYHLKHPVGPEEESRTSELRGLIERMGEINLTAIEESAQLQKRYDYLTGQKQDLESAIAQLESAIDKINRASKKRFREIFDAVNAKFQEVFPRCFGGGKARLALTDDSDLLETGVEIIANPPGKKIMQSLELLSGGEKAMTAVALLFSIFLVKPSPFCLLDEVDAPLDEANVGRFNQMVRAMTDRAQFIMITHNRRSMENADRLCGITMEEPGVSKLVAVNLRGARKTLPSPGASDSESAEGIQAEQAEESNGPAAQTAS
jgi:chromosome segregation protein